MKRLEQLDSIRGIAAIFVFFNHLLLISPLMFGNNSNVGIFILKETPIHLFWGGHEAVLVFFILSGYVLSLSFLTNKPPKYLIYLKKRVVRLYIPYIVALFFAIMMNTLLFSGKFLNGTSEWINYQWKNYDSRDIISHLLFIGEFDTHIFNGPIWSLVHEMRISIIFPILMLFILKISWVKNIIMILVLSLVGFILSRSFGSSNINYFITIHYAAIFMAGALLSKYQINIIERVKRLNNRNINLLSVVSLLLISYNYWVFPSIRIFHIEIISDWITLIGAAIFIVLSVSSIKVEKALLNRNLMFIGKISYSFYLYHFIVLLSMLYIFNETLALWAIGIISLLITIILASIMYYLIEMPSIKLTKKMSKSSIENSIISKNENIS